MKRIAYLLCVLTFACGFSAQAEVPRKISFQGQISSPEGVWLLGKHEFTFRVFADSTGGMELWSESDSLLVENGVFQTNLGSRIPLPSIVFSSGQVMWLETEIDGAVLSARQPLVSVAYSFHAERADTAGYALSAPATAWEESGGNVYRSSGNVGIGTTTPLYPLTIRRDSDAFLSYLVMKNSSSGAHAGVGLNFLNDQERGLGLGTLGSATNLYPAYGGPGESFLYSGTQGKALNVVVPDETNGKLNFFIGTNASGTPKMVVTQNGDIGIGTATPTRKLHIVGTSVVLDNLGDNFRIYGASDDAEHNHYLHLLNSTGLSSAWGLKAGGILVGDSYSYADPGKNDLIVKGQVGIGTAAPTTKLQVAGTVYSTSGGFKFPDGTVQTTAASGGITGSGSVNFVPKFTASTVLGNSSLYDTGGNVGIGTTSPSRTLDVAGLARVAGSSTNSALSVSNSSTGSGVFGQTSADKSVEAGVSGKANADGGSGVYGTTSSLGITNGSSVAVYGWASGGGGSVGGAALGVLGRVASHQQEGNSVPAGAFGWATATSGVNAGVWGQSESADGYGVYGATTNTTGTGNHGVVGRCDSPNGRGVYYAGGLAGSGPKSCVVKSSKGPLLLYCQESPENWFEDFGEARLVNGRVHVELDPLFLETIAINEQHPMKVFVQLTDECKGVFVKRGLTGFDVVELGGGNSNAEFVYRVVAKRKDLENNRLDVYEPARMDPYLYPEMKEALLHKLPGGESEK